MWYRKKHVEMPVKDVFFRYGRNVLNVCAVNYQQTFYGVILVRDSVRQISKWFADPQCTLICENYIFMVQVSLECFTDEGQKYFRTFKTLHIDYQILFSVELSSRFVYSFTYNLYCHCQALVRVFFRRNNWNVILFVMNLNVWSCYYNVFHTIGLFLCPLGFLF